MTKMDHIKSFKYLRPDSTIQTKNPSVGELLPLGISWLWKGNMYHRTNVSGGICAVLLNADNVIAIVENPYITGFNPAYVINGENQVIWNVSDLFITVYGSKYHDRNGIHFMDVRTENNMLCFFVNISNSDFRFSINIKTGELGRLIEAR